jgi:16S rRNA (cytosine1402-N4)-methyltransferase
MLAPAGRRMLLDCTVGLGGHAEALLDAAGPEATLLGVDVDEANLQLARQRLERFGERVRLFQANFSEADEVLAQAGAAAVDVILADLGIASTQLDDPQRGLSFRADGPLDMRLDPRQTRTASDLVNTLGETELADLVYEFGEERYSRRIARAIVAARTGRRIERTAELAEIVAKAMPAATKRTRRGVHPATRTFQALRIAVNDEMASLDRLLERLPDLLAPGGRAGIISFHSLEDRRVKRAFASWADTGRAKRLSRKPVTPAEDEMAANPRSRSAKLRGIERIE